MVTVSEISFFNFREETIALEKIPKSESKCDLSYSQARISVVLIVAKAVAQR